MNLENKYYTPKIEDFHIGFEFEIKDRRQNFPKVGKTMDITGEWRAAVCNNFNDPIFNQWNIDTIYATLEWDKEQIRVPYLTAEQIKAEGWKMSSVSTSNFYRNDHAYELFYYADSKSLSINFKDYLPEKIIFRGKCRCINDFRLIIKLLEI